MLWYKVQPAAQGPTDSHPRFRITAPAKTAGLVRASNLGADARRPYVMILGFAAVLRAIWAVVVPVIPVSDSVAYDTFARNLAAGLAYGWDGHTPSAYWPVGAPFMYSLVYRLLDPNMWGYAPAVALNLAIGVAVVGLSMMLAHRWFGRSVALACGIILAAWPMHVQFTTILASESIFTALCLAGILAWPATGRRVVLMAVGTGLLFAAATYVRPTALLIPIVLAAASVIKDRKVLEGALRLATVLLVMGLCLAPWAYRNAVQIGTPALVATNGGPNLWMGNNPSTDGFYQALPPQPVGMSEAQFHNWLGDKAVGYIREKPVAFIGRSAIKAVRLYERETIGVVWNEPGIRAALPVVAVAGLKIESQGYWVLTLAASVAGFVILIRTQGWWKVAWHPVLIIPAYFTAVHAVIVVQDRYHFPMTPMIAMFAAIAVVRLYRWNLDRRRPPEAA